MNNPIEFKGRTEDKIVSSLIRKTTMFSEKVDNSEKLGELKEKNEVLVVYFGESEGDLEWKTYKLLA